VLHQQITDSKSDVKIPLFSHHNCLQPHMQMKTTCSIDINVQQTSATIADFGSRSNIMAIYSSNNIQQQEQHSQQQEQLRQQQEQHAQQHEQHSQQQEQQQIFKAAQWQHLAVCIQCMLDVARLYLSWLFLGCHVQSLSKPGSQ